MWQKAQILILSKTKNKIAVLIFKKYLFLHLVLLQKLSALNGFFIEKFFSKVPNKIKVLRFQNVNE